MRNQIHSGELRLAFTLPEMLVTVAVSTLVVAGVLSAHLFGLHLYQFTKPKLCASDGARKTVSLLVGQLRGTTRIRVGQGSLNSFTEAPNGSLQQGNAIQIYTSTNTNVFIRYFCDPSDRNLKLVTNGSSSAEILANCISNQLVFTSEDYAGNILTNNQGNRVIGLTMQFYQIEYPIMLIGTNQFYDFYQLRTRVTQRKLPQP